MLEENAIGIGVSQFSYIKMIDFGRGDHRLLILNNSHIQMAATFLYMLEPQCG